MPRRIATQVSQLISRQLRGGLLKRPPVAFDTLLNHPNTPLPARAPVERSNYDTRILDERQWNAETMTGSSKIRTKPRKLGPQPIVYLEDRVRERFYNDHPWETFQPRTLVESRTLSDRRLPHPDATDLTAWGRNPSPEDVIACVVHLHRRHGLSLSQAYHNTLSSYHGLRAEHEHSSRIALFEARSYGAVFAHTFDGQPSSAKEIERGFRKEGEELRKGAKAFAKTLNGANLFGSSAGPADEELDESARRKYRFRVANTWSPNSQGVKYLEAALAARDGKIKEQEPAAAESTPSSKAYNTPSTESLMSLLTSRSGSAQKRTAAEKVSEQTTS